MKLFLRLIPLCAAVLAQSMPLQIGRTWSWQVYLPYFSQTTSNGRCVRRARVLDSIRLDPASALARWRPRSAGGIVWRIQAEDSASGLRDTGEIVSWPDGIQVWGKLSRWLDWEPATFSALSQAGLVGEDTSEVWGLDSLLDSTGHFTAKGGYPWGAAAMVASGNWRRQGSTYAFGHQGIFVSEFEGATAVSLPFLICDSFGPARFQVGEETWERTQIDSVLAPPTASLLPEPGPGRCWTWWREQEARSCDVLLQCSQTQERTLVADSLLEHLPDSLGWARFEALERIGEVSNLRHCRILRFHPDSTTDCPDVATAWIRDWRADSTDEGLRLWKRIAYWRPMNAKDEHWSFQRSFVDGTLDSMVQFASSHDPNGPTRKITTRHLLVSMDGRGIRPDPSMALMPVRKTRVSEFYSLASRFPHAALQWRDFSGRGGKMSAYDLTHRKLGMIWVNGSFPDGTRWQGTLLPAGIHSKR